MIAPPLQGGPAPCGWPHPPSQFRNTRCGSGPLPPGTAPATGPPCRCRQAGSAPARVPARSSSAASPTPRPALSPRPAGGPGDPTATSGWARGAARSSTVSARGSTPPAACLPPAAPPRCHIGSGQRRKRPSPASGAGGGQCSAAPWRPAVSSAAPWRPAARAGWRGVERGALDRDHWRRRCPDRGSLLTRLHFKVAARVRVPQNPPMLADEEAAWGGRASSRDGEGWTGGRLGALGVGVVAARGVLSVRLPLPRAELHLPEGPLPAGDRTAQAGAGSHEAPARSPTHRPRGPTCGSSRSSP